MSNAVIVTGQRGGLGSALTKEFTSSGFHVIGMDLEVGDESDAGYEHAQISVDLKALTDPNEGNRLKDRIQHELRDHDLLALVNNAATQHVQTLAQLDPTVLIESLKINAVAPLVLGQLLFANLQQNAGSILNISSIHVDQTKRRFGAYSISKSALSAVTRAMAIEWGDRIRVMELRPAAISTEMLEAGFVDRQEARRQLNEYHPTGRIGTPAEIARISRQLIELDAPFLNGTVVNTDGGISHMLHDPDD